MRFLAILTAASCATLAAGTLDAQQIGVVASIERDMVATAPGQSQRRLTSGDDVVADDSIRTGASARGQLMFLDESTLTVAPSSQITLDRFVYDPNGGSAGFGLKLTTGALRFVGGATSEAQEAEIVTPTATLGIRGSSALVRVSGGRTVAVFLTGDRLCMTVGGKRNCTSQRSGVMTEDGYAGRASPELMKSLLSQIDGQAPTRLAASGSGATVGVVDAMPPTGAPVSSRGRRKGVADIDGFARLDRDRGVNGFDEPAPVTDPNLDF